MFFCVGRWAGLVVDFDENKTETIEIKDSERFMIQIGDTIMPGLHEFAAVNRKEFLQICRVILTDAVNGAITHHRASKQTHRSNFASSESTKAQCFAFLAAPTRGWEGSCVGASHT